MALDGLALKGHLGVKRPSLGANRGAVMTPLVWIAVALMLVGAFMLVAGIGAPALWIAVVTVGIALVAIDRVRGRRSLGS
jgi:hypothetical protein